MANPIQDILTRTNRRLFLVDCSINTGRLFVISLICAAGLLILSRLTGEWVPIWVIIVVGLLGIPLGVLRSLLKRRQQMTIAVLLDRYLELKDLIATAVELECADDDAPQPTLGDAVVRQAESVAAKVRSQTVVRWRWPASWTASVVLMGLLISGYFLLPEQNLWNRSNDDNFVSPRLIARQQTAEDAIQNAADRLRNIASQNSTDPKDKRDPEDQLETARAAEVLDRLASQLNPEQRTQSPNTDEMQNKNVADQNTQTAESSNANGLESKQAANNREATANAEQSVAEATETLNTLADRLDEKVLQERQDYHDLMEQLAQIDKPEQNTAADDFIESLRRGDLDDAADQLDNLRELTQNMSSEEKQQVAEQLRETLPPPPPTPSGSQSSLPASPENESSETAEQTDASSNTSDLRDTSNTPDMSNESGKPDDSDEHNTPDNPPDSTPNDTNTESQVTDRANTDPQNDSEATGDISNNSNDDAIGPESNNDTSNSNDLDSGNSNTETVSQPDTNEHDAETTSKQEGNRTAKETDDPADTSNEITQQEDSTPPTAERDNESEDQQDKPQTEPGNSEESAPDTAESETNDDSPPMSEGINKLMEDFAKSLEEDIQSTDTPENSAIDPKNDPDLQESPDDTRSTPSSKSIDETIKNLKDAIENAADAPERARKKAQDSEEIRDVARDLVDKLSPEEQQKLKKMFDDLEPDSLDTPSGESQDSSGNDDGNMPNTSAGNDGATLPNDATNTLDESLSYDTELVDARPDETSTTPQQFDSSVLSDLLPKGAGGLAAESTNTPMTNAQNAGVYESRAAKRARFLSAAQKIEHALHEESIAPRYRDLAKRFVKRLKDSSQSVEGN